MLEPMLCVTPTAELGVASAQLIWLRHIARVEFHRSLKFSKRASPLTAPAVNSGSGPPTVRDSRVKVDGPVRFSDGPVEFSQRRLKVVTPPVMKYTQCQMCIRQIWRNR